MEPFPRLLVLGDRGAPDVALENTLESLARARAQGADGVKVDIRIAADGVPVVIHDGTLQRTFGRREEVARITWPALQQLTGARLPDLQQVAAWAAASESWLNVEIRAGGSEQTVVEILRDHGLTERCFLSASDDAVLTKLGRIAPSVRRFLVAESWNEAVAERAAHCGVNGVCLRVDEASPFTIEVVRREGYAVAVWTVDDPAHSVTLAREGVAAIITNRPGEIAEALIASGYR